MDAELKAEWLKALRGGKYKQGDGYLRLNGKFCCLGVACDLLDPTKWSGGEDESYSYENGDDGALCVWPQSVESRFGLTGRQSRVLWQMNDAGKSFAEIADYIEANL